MPESEGLSIGDWEIARHVSEWIEIVAVVVIAISVVAAFVAGLHAWRATSVEAGIDAIKRQIGRGLVVELEGRWPWQLGRRKRIGSTTLPDSSAPSEQHESE